MCATDLLDFGGVLTLYSFLDTTLGLVLSPHKPFMVCQYSVTYFDTNSMIDLPKVAP